jgi:hypothetical protein
MLLELPMLIRLVLAPHELLHPSTLQPGWEMQMHHMTFWSASFHDARNLPSFFTLCKWVSDWKLREAFFFFWVHVLNHSIISTCTQSLPHTLVVLQQIQQNSYNYKNICKLALQRLSRTGVQQHDNKIIQYINH